MKRFIKILFSLGAVLSIGMLSACTQSTPQKNKRARTTITFWHAMSGPNQQTLNDMIRDFNRSQSTYKVVGSSQGNFSNIQQKITAAAKSNTLPTLAQTTYTNEADYVHGGFIVPLDHYVGAKTLTELDPSLRQSTQYQGKTYSLPFSKSIRILYYNKDLLKKTGAKLPKTWTALQQIGPKAKAHGITTLALDQSFAGELDALTHAAGTPLLQSNPQVNNRKTIAATHAIWDMLKQKTATTAGTDGFGNVQFLKGKTLFYSGTSAALSIIKASAPKGFHWGTAAFPSYQGKRATTIQGNDLVTFKSASPKQRRGAVAFMKFLLTKKQTLRWAEATGYLPLTSEALKSQEYQAYLAKNPAVKTAASSLPFGFTDKTFYGYNQSLTTLNQTISQLNTLQTSPEKAMNQLQSKLKTIANQK